MEINEHRIENYLTDYPKILIKCVFFYTGKAVREGVDCTCWVFDES